MEQVSPFPSRNSCSPAALSIILKLQPNPNVRNRTAISVWYPRTHPLLRATTALKCFNRAFGELCDTSSFGSGAMADVFPLAPAFSSQEYEAEAWASMEEAMTLLDALHQGHLARSSCCFLHVSRLGRANRVLLEVLPVCIDNQLLEYIMLETPLAEHLQGPTPYPTLIEGTQPSSGSAPQAPAQASFPRCPSEGMNSKRGATQMIREFDVKKKRCDWVFIADEKRKKHSTLTSVLCYSCGITETTQKRRGPNGMGTMCNKCGLRWLRSTQTGCA